MIALARSQSGGKQLLVRNASTPAAAATSPPLPGGTVYHRRAHISTGSSGSSPRRVPVASGRVVRDIVNCCSLIINLFPTPTSTFSSPLLLPYRHHR